MAPGPTGRGGGREGGRGGGRGGSREGGRGGPPVPALAPVAVAAPLEGNGRLKGKEPTIFTGDQGKADEFMHKLKLYQFLNRATPLM